MTREEKIICKEFLNDADKTHSCNEYKLLIALLEQEPTTKNDLAVDFIEYAKKTFGIELTFKKSDNPDTYEKLFGTTKNDLPHCQYTDEEIAKSFIEDVEAVKEQLPNKDNLGVDCISRTQTQTEIEMHASRYTISRERGYMGHVEWSDQLIKVSDAVDIIRNLPSVTPQEPKSEWEHDHEILKAYSDGQASIITVLEAIKAEIEQSRYGLINDGLDVALKIIDKHISEMGDMAEIEPQESEG